VCEAPLVVTEHFSQPEIQHPILRLPMRRGDGPTSWGYITPPLCPQGHLLLYPNVIHGHTPPRLHRFHCLTCTEAGEPHDTWYVEYPRWDKERQDWMFPER
jgi:hypothetical protein